MMDFSVALGNWHDMTEGRPTLTELHFFFFYLILRNIRRVIFEAVEKFDGNVVRSLSLTQLKQIAGRAGRFGTDYAVGQATTLLQADIQAVKRALAAPMTDIKVKSDKKRRMG